MVESNLINLEQKTKKKWCNVQNQDGLLFLIENIEEQVKFRQKKVFNISILTMKSALFGAAASVGFNYVFQIYDQKADRCTTTHSGQWLNSDDFWIARQADLFILKIDWLRRIEKLTERIYSPKETENSTYDHFNKHRHRVIQLMYTSGDPSLSSIITFRSVWRTRVLKTAANYS